jgi:hypothetical protein
MDQLNLVLAAAFGLASAAVIGGIKALEARANAQLVSKLGNLTPVLVVALNLALPKLSTLLGLTNLPDAATFVNAPVASAVAILAREAFVKVLHQPDPGAGAPPVVDKVGP